MTSIKVFVDLPLDGKPVKSFHPLTPSGATWVQL